MACSPIKKKKIWIIKAVDHCTGRTIAWVLGDRDVPTFQRLYDKVKHLKHCLFYTDNWDACAKILPKERHSIGKTYTQAIERDNSHTRHHLARMTRKTNVVSKSEDMIHASFKLWCALNVPEIFAKYQALFLSIFRWTLSGRLLTVAEQAGYALLINTDQNLRYQQHLADRHLAILVLLSTSWPRIQRRLEAIQAAVERGVAGGCEERSMQGIIIFGSASSLRPGHTLGALEGEQGTEGTEGRSVFA